MFIIRREIRDLIVDKLHLICLQALQIIGLPNQACQRESSKADHILSCIPQFDKKLLYLVVVIWEKHLLKITHCAIHTRAIKVTLSNFYKRMCKEAHLILFCNAFLLQRALVL